MFSASGGLLYHWRARRSKALWQPFVADLEKLLAAWASKGELIVIGPSGGYSLSTGWLKKFRRVIAFDIDPLAPWFFKNRHFGVEFHKQDMFFDSDGLSFKPLLREIEKYPQARILFANVFGQLPLERELRDGELPAYLRKLAPTLKDRAWASYHDLYTLENLPLNRHASALQSYRKTRSIAALSGEVIDHTTQGVWTGGKILGWSLTSRSLHLIEFYSPY